ncbi:hypothetical protein NNX28_15275 [Arthrobacter sp. zg-Y859]|uniref:Uncharacterized protein n=1 Tax=Arthrobacter jinronghuae TaxID=2964609 RepID=A0ABT1NXP3_9MICC|nr:hypothetical protein [Arthrobacter jinronghuae]MCQ1951279.1 hypothetical protein [Arthrobacter jinronghuae]UWX78949.1 hypothetical protein N2K98_01635 [Arthrobacter jinronghuae]
MPEDKDFEHNETKAEAQLQIVDPPEPGDEEAGQQQAGHADGSPTGGPEDPTAEEQNVTGEPDDQQNEPLPRTWN